MFNYDKNGTMMKVHLHAHNNFMWANPQNVALKERLYSPIKEILANKYREETGCQHNSGKQGRSRFKEYT